MVFHGSRDRVLALRQTDWGCAVVDRAYGQLPGIFDPWGFNLFDEIALRHAIAGLFWNKMDVLAAAFLVATGMGQIGPGSTCGSAHAMRVASQARSKDMFVMATLARCQRFGFAVWRYRTRAIPRNYMIKNDIEFFRNQFLRFQSLWPE